MSTLLVAEFFAAALSIDRRPKNILQSFHALLDSEKGQDLPSVLNAIRTLEARSTKTP